MRDAFVFITTRASVFVLDLFFFRFRFGAGAKSSYRLGRLAPRAGADALLCLWFHRRGTSPPVILIIKFCFPRAAIGKDASFFFHRASILSRFPIFSENVKLRARPALFVYAKWRIRLFSALQVIGNHETATTMTRSGRTYADPGRCGVPETPPGLENFSFGPASGVWPTDCAGFSCAHNETGPPNGINHHPMEPPHAFFCICSVPLVCASYGISSTYRPPRLCPSPISPPHFRVGTIDPSQTDFFSGVTRRDWGIRCRLLTGGVSWLKEKQIHNRNFGKNVGAALGKG